jgi:hypothetical protein
MKFVKRKFLMHRSVVKKRPDNLRAFFLQLIKG